MTADIIYPPQFRTAPCAALPSRIAYASETEYPCAFETGDRVILCPGAMAPIRGTVWARPERWPGYYTIVCDDGIQRVAREDLMEHEASFDNDPPRHGRRLDPF